MLTTLQILRTASARASLQGAARSAHPSGGPLPNLHRGGACSRRRRWRLLCACARRPAPPVRRFTQSYLLPCTALEPASYHDREQKRNPGGGSLGFSRNDKMPSQWETLGTLPCNPLRALGSILFLLDLSGRARPSPTYRLDSSKVQFDTLRWVLSSGVCGAWAVLHLTA